MHVVFILLTGSLEILCAVQVLGYMRLIHFSQQTTA